MSSNKSTSKSRQTVSPEALSQRFLNEDEFVKASRETIFGVVSALLDDTVQHLVNESVQDSPNSCSSKIKGKQNISPDLTCDNKDLPVRRSSRIQSKTVKKEEPAKKKRNTKTEDTTKFIDVVSVDEDVEESKSPLELESKAKVTDLTEQAPFEKEMETSKKHKDNASKPQKTSTKRSHKKSDKKEDLNTSEKPKPERKRNGSRKRKQDITDSDNVSDPPNSNNDQISSNNNIYKNIIKDNGVAVTKVIRTPVVKTQEFQSIETKIEMSCASIKNDDDKSNEVSDNSENSNLKPVKVKSRWWRSSELEGVLKTELPVKILKDSINNDQNEITKCYKATEFSDIKENKIQDTPTQDILKENLSSNESVTPLETALSKESVIEMSTESTELKPLYEHIDENIYRFEKKKSKIKKQVRRMICDCTLTKEELECGILGCKEECLNRLLMIECGNRCPIGEACSNKRFQKKQQVKAEIFKAENKGWGLRALQNISKGDFIMEFVGEVLNHKEYRQRVKQYAKDKNVHCYFMALKTDEILDATSKGNFSRFINHSCDPNSETQKWTVNGELRVGVFARRSISLGEEFTLDYQFQRYGREAQKCLCGSHNCSGYIGGNKQISIDAYSISKSGSKSKRKGVEEKKRDWEDMTLEEEIEKLNGFKGLRNREENLKFARLMVRADDNTTRHQLLDIIIKTEEQACLRLFLDYHGLPLLWSWMTDVVDLELKTKILKVLQMLPIPNKTMLLDSKVMSIVEKWVQESDVVQKDSTDPKIPFPEYSSDGGSDLIAKKLKLSDFSDSETDSSGSHHAADITDNKASVNISKTIFSSSGMTLITTNDSYKIELSPSEIPLPDTLPESKSSKLSLDSTDTLRKDISSAGSELLCMWKNLKEVFRIPRLEQQKRRKEDEREADHSVLSRVQSEIKKPEPEVTGNQIQVLISMKPDDMNNFDFDNPDMNYKHDRRNHKNLAKVPCSNKPIRRVDELLQSLSEDSSLDSPSSVLSANMNTSPVLQHNQRPALVTIPTFMNQTQINYPQPVIPPTIQPPPPSQTIFPPQQIIYPQNPQVNFLSTAIPPPTIAPHPPTNMPPPTPLMTKQPPPLLQQPPPTNIPPPCQTALPPPISTNYILPPNVPPVSSIPPTSQPHFIPNQTVPVSNFPPNPSPFGNQNQPFYYVQQPNVSNPPSEINFPENLPIQQISSIPVQSATSTSIPSLPNQLTNLQMQTTNPISLSSNLIPIQSLNPAVLQSSLPQTILPVQEIEPIPVVIEEKEKVIKLPKNWRSATDSEGNTYYYHSVTRETQWDPPSANKFNDGDDSEDEEEDSASEESDSSDTPTYDEPKVLSKPIRKKSKKKKTTKAAADTSVSFPVRPEVAKKIKELFRTKMSTFIVQCLNHYRKPDCKVGRITNNDDFKYLARKLTHYIMTKEIKQLKNVEDLDCNETVTHKAKDFIKKYMSKYGAKYNRKEKCSPT